MYDGSDDDEERISKVKQKPELHRFDAGSAGEAGGHRQVDRGQDHHAGDVHCHQQVIALTPSSHVDCSLTQMGL